MQEGEQPIFLVVLGFNRTFMELKSTSNAPKTGADSGFNRTFMELKYMYNGVA